jgi:hypothetical protein
MTECGRVTDQLGLIKTTGIFVSFARGRLSPIMLSHGLIVEAELGVIA